VQLNAAGRVGVPLPAIAARSSTSVATGPSLCGITACVEASLHSSPPRCCAAGWHSEISHHDCDLRGCAPNVITNNTVHKKSGPLALPQACGVTFLSVSVRITVTRPSLKKVPLSDMCN
jgi:hypothetical protein